MWKDEPPDEMKEVADNHSVVCFVDNVTSVIGLNGGVVLTEYLELYILILQRFYSTQ